MVRCDNVRQESVNALYRAQRFEQTLTCFDFFLLNLLSEVNLCLVVSLRSVHENDSMHSLKYYEII